MPTPDSETASCLATKGIAVATEARALRAGTSAGGRVNSRSLLGELPCPQLPRLNITVPRSQRGRGSRGSGDAALDEGQGPVGEGVVGGIGAALVERRSPEATSVVHEERKGRHIHPETELFEGKLRKTVGEQCEEARPRLGDGPFD